MTAVRSFVILVDLRVTTAIKWVLFRGIMSLVSLQDVQIGFRGPLLLDGVSCQIHEKQRIGLLGRNGAGKTTLMRMLCGQIEPDRGEIVVTPQTGISWLPQEVPRDLTGNVEEIVYGGLPEDGEDETWQKEQKVEQILSRMKLEPSAAFESFSSGMKRRVLLARAIVSEPDVLLLDEPTNHLDIESIEWLETFLLRWPKTLLFVTHDRMFLRKIATRILEIDRGQIFDWSCDYDTFLQRKEAALAAEEKQNALFDKMLAQEEVWIRQGIKARRTRNEGRVRALKKMREARRERREQPEISQLQIQEGQRSGGLVVAAKKLSFAYEDQKIVDDFSTMVMRGDKIGVIGKNGAGKTTLLKILLGKLQPQSGDVRLGTNLQIAYFDQLREQLHPERTVEENVGDGYQTIQINGGSKHVLGYLQDFLFTPERARTAVKFLSGGERNRVLLAKLFAKPANVIVLDEPTNDLDTETLELLEQRLVDYQGTVLLVSHDRAFLNNVVTSTIAVADGRAKEYDGGYDDWFRQDQQAVTEEVKPPPKAAEKPKKPTKVADSQRKLKYKEQQELAALPQTIESLETQIADLHELMADPDFYQQAGDVIAEKQTQLKQLESELAEAYTRWEFLEGLGS